MGPLSEPRVGVITVLAALDPELASAPGSKPSSNESSSLATHKLPALSNATPDSVLRPPLGVVRMVAGTRCPVSVSWVGSRRRMPGGFPLTTHSPFCAAVGGGGGGGGEGGTTDFAAWVPQPAARARSRASAAWRTDGRIESFRVRGLRAGYSFRMDQAVGPLVLGGSVFREIGCQMGDYASSPFIPTQLCRGAP